MTFNPGTIAALVIAISFAAGLNLYATLLTLGLLARFHWVAVPSGLEALTNPWIIGASAVLYSTEFVADKIPLFDLLWNAAHTLIRIPAAALLSYAAASHLSPGLQILATLVGGSIAAVSHASKFAARAVITPSPEPVSNIAFSTAEDLAAIGLTWTATHHPFAAASAVGLLLVLGIWIIKTGAAAARRALRRLRGSLPSPNSVSG